MRVGEADEKFWGLSSVVILSTSLGAFQSNLGILASKLEKEILKNKG